MKRRIVSAIVISSCIALPLNGESVSIEAQYSAQYSSCLQKAQGVTPRINECLQNELDLWDRKLNQSYQRLRKSMPPEQFALLREGQLAWIKYRESACDRVYKSGMLGTAAMMEGLSCSIQFTVLKTLELYALEESWNYPQSAE